MISFKKINPLYSLIPLVILLILVIAGIWYFRPDSLMPRSYTDLSIEGDQLKISFNISNQDQAVFDQFMTNLGVNNLSANQFGFKLNDQSIQQLKPFLPVRAYLQIQPKQIMLQTNNTSSLQSSIPLQDYHYATGSAELDLKSDGGQSVELNVVEPDLLVRSATASGQLYLSDQLTSLFPTLSKIATIELNVEQGNIKGSIQLK